MSLSFPLVRASIPEIRQKCHHFAAFAGASAKYLGERNGVLVKERGNEWKKERFTISASLCGGGDLLKALGSVAHYLADGIFYSTNDTEYVQGVCVIIGKKDLQVALRVCACDDPNEC